MSDSVILYAGFVSFALVILGFVLTAREFSGPASPADAGKRQAKAADRT